MTLNAPEQPDKNSRSPRFMGPGKGTAWRDLQVREAGAVVPRSLPL